MIARRACLAALAATVFMGGAQAADKVTWTAYSYMPAVTLAPARAMTKIAQEIEAATNGELTLKYHIANALPISSTNITQAVSDNVVQLGDDGFHQGNIPISGVVRLPLLVASTQELEKAMVIMRPYIAAAYDKKGMVVLGDYYFPLQVAWSRKKLTSFEDMKGQKMRVTSPEQGEFVKRFGGSPVTIAGAEVPSALDRGVVDGVFTASAGGGKLWKDLLKFTYRFGPNYFDGVIVANKEAYAKLSPATQATLKKMITEQTPWMTQTMRDEEDQETAKMKAEGMTVTAGTLEDQKFGAERMASFWESWAKSRGPDAVEALGKVRAALGR